MNICGFIGPQEIIILFIIGGIFLIPLVALIDIVRSNFKDNNKLIWVLIVLLLPFFGALLYLLIGLNQKIKKE